MRPTWSSRVVQCASGIVVAVACYASSVAEAAGPQFSAPVIVSSGPRMGGVVAADLNGDRKPDLAVADGLVDTLSVIIGKGDGSFYRRVRYEARASRDVAVADLTGDGWPDLVALGDSRRRGVITVFVNDGLGGFRRDRVYASAATLDGGRVAVGDVDGNGVTDVLVGDMFTGDLAVLLGTGGGRLAAARTVPGRGSRDLAVGDFNADGRLDVALATHPGRLVTVRLALSDGTFGPAHAVGLSGDDDEALAATTADINHDGMLDLVVTLYSGGVAVLEGNGDGTFGAQTEYRGRYPTDLTLSADFDGDGNTDIATPWFTSRFYVRLGGGDGTFHNRLTLPSLDTYFDSYLNFISDGAVADFNLDSRPDIAVIASGGDLEVSAAGVLLNWTGLGAAPCVVVPITREPLRRAKAHLRSAGCRAGQVRYRYSRKVRRGRVISQQPRRGTVQASQASVDVLVSRGRRPR